MTTRTKVSMEKHPKKDLSKYKRGELAFTILKYCAIGIFIGGVIVCPNLAQLYKFLEPKSNLEKRKIKRAIAQLHTAGYLVKTSNPLSPLTPTRKGIQRSEYDSLTIHPTANWDGLWRFCMFDIPEENLTRRKLFSFKVSEMGMRLFQKSVYLSPYPCETELLRVARYLGVEKYVRFTTATEISEEENFKKSFKLS